MDGLSGFEQVKDVACDGFGPIVEGRRDGRTWTIRPFVGISRRSIPDAMVQRLAHPPHPVILPTEIGATSDGIYLAAPTEGRPVCTLVNEHPGAVVQATRCVEIGIALAEAAIAVTAAGHGSRLGPLSWSNIYLEPARPGLVWMLPLWILRTRTSDWLRHAVPDLMFVDRDTLRQAAGPRADAFAIGAVLLVLAGGSSALPALDVDAAGMIRRAITDGHPLLEARPGDGALTAVIGRALGQRAAGEPLDSAALVRALAETCVASDPMVNAIELHRAGKGLEAMKLLHKAMQDGQRALPLQLLKARIEIDRRLVDRAERTLRDALETAPASREVLVLLGDLAGDPGQASEHYARALAVDPLDVELKLKHALALERAGKLEQALGVLDEVRQAATIDPSLERFGARAALRMGRLMIEMRRYPASARSLVEPYLMDDELDMRADALAVTGAAHAEQGAFAEAEHLLRDALAIEDRPRPFVLNHLAYALVATGKPEEARKFVHDSLRQDAGQESLWRLLVALGG